MEHIKIILENYLKKRQIGKFLSSEKEKGREIFNDWNEIIGEKYKELTKPYRILNNKLFIYVENSVIMSELIYKKRRIIEKINKKFSMVIKDLVFKIRQ